MRLQNPPVLERGAKVGHPKLFAAAPTLVTSLFALFATSPALQAQLPDPVQLSPTYEEGAAVYGVPAASADGEWIFFSAFATPGEMAALYRVARTGLPVQKVSPSPSSLEFRSPEISADQRVVFIGREVNTQTSSLWQMPITGSSPVVLHQGPAGLHLDFELFGSWVILRRLDVSLPGAELYLVPVSGPSTAAQRLDQNRTRNFRLLEEPARIVFDDGGALYVAPLVVGTEPVRLDSPGSGAAVQNFWVTPDRQTVLFVVEDAASDRSLMAVGITGTPTPWTVNGSLPAGQSMNSFDDAVQITSDSTHAIFSTKHPGAPADQLYSVPVDGPTTAQIRLDAGLTILDQARILADDQTVVYRARQQNPDRFDVYRVPITGPAAAAERLNPTTESVYQLTPTDDGQQIVFWSDGGAFLGSTGSPSPLFRVAALEATPTIEKISVLGLANEVDADELGRQIGNRWVYTGRIDDGPLRELFSVGLTGAAFRTSRRLNLNPDEAFVSNISALPGDEWITFTDRPFDFSQTQVMLAPVDGSRPTEAAHGLLPPWFSSTFPTVMSDGHSILYTLRAEDPTPQGPTLYLQRIPVVFEDGFESGDSSTWSASSP